MPRLSTIIALASLASSPAFAQHPPGQASSANVKLVAHVPLAGWDAVSDIEIEQELSRPYAYVAVDMHGKEGDPTGIDIISLKDLNHARVIRSLRVSDPALHRGAGSLNPEYLKSRGRYYLTAAFQFAKSGPDADLGAEDDEDLDIGEEEEPSADDEVDLGGDDDLGVEAPNEDDEH